MKRTSAIVFFFLLISVAVWPQNYTLKGKVEEIVHVGERFRLSYTINATDVEDFKLGQMPDAIDVLYGPAQSTSISSVYSNGHSSTTRTLTLTYTLSANEEGQFTIPPSSIVVEGQTIRSSALTVHVIASTARNNSSQTQSSLPTSSEYFFVLANTTKRRVVEYEPFLLTYKVCWHNDLPVINLDDINLELQDVYMQPYNDTQQKSKKVEQIGGRTLVTVDWKQYVIYPQKAGTLHLPSLSFMGYVRQDMAIDPYDPFSSRYREIPQQLRTPEVNIQVDPLPERPVDFSGGVGRLRLSATPDKTTLKANTPLKLSVTVSGQGNLNMLKEPIVSYPSSFDTYDTRQTENYQVTSDGISGDIVYEFMAVPQREGSYVLPPVKLVYYDLDARDYRTLASDSFRITVTPGEPGSSSMADYSDGDGTRQGDIRPIRTGPGKVVDSRQHTFFGSAAYWLAIAMMVVLTVIAFFILHHRALGRGDVAKRRADKARQLATRRLRKAERLMRSASVQPFFEETLRALWGYVGDRLNMPVSTLTRDNVSQRLTEWGISQQPIEQFVKVLDECEFMRYAPGDPQGNMNHVYEMAVNAIVQIEKEMKNKKTKSKATTTLLLVALLCLFCTQGNAFTKEEADEAFRQGDYERAVEIYGQIVQQTTDADVYYNMGNAYYRLGDMAHAILNYERALMLQPGDDDSRFNLQLAYSKTEDRIAPEREMFFVTWYRALSSLFGVDTWAVISLVALAVALVLAVVYWFASSVSMRKISFFVSLLLLFVFLLGNLFAWQQRRTLSQRAAAIVMQQEVNVNAMPSDGATTQFTLHAGTKVSVTDNSMAGWLQILLPDGRQGWVQAEAVEVI